MMEQTECSETSEYKLQTPMYYPKESIQHTEHGESLKSRITTFCLYSAGMQYNFVLNFTDPFQYVKS